MLSELAITISIMSAPKLGIPIMAYIDDHLDEIIELEGGFTHDPLDRGGPTKYGITLATLLSVNPDASIDDVRNLTEEQAKDIFKQLYYYRYNIDRLDPMIQAPVLDAVILHGPRAITWAQKALRELTGHDLEIDGIIGNRTANASKCVDPKAFRQLFAAHRAAAVSKLVMTDPSQKKFFKGWINRISHWI